MCIRRILIVPLCVILAGCSSAFEREWGQHHVDSEAEHPAVGRWEGAWRSYRTERQGDLRCVVSRQAVGRYVAHFQVTVRRLWSRNHEYKVLMKAEPGGDGRVLMGSRDFGWASGGVVHYRGEIDGDLFKCLYSGDEDRGVFELTRYTGDGSSPFPP